MRINGLKSRGAGHRNVGFVAASALAAVAMLTLSAVAVAASGPILAKSGAGNEGPYPYAYPASGKIAAGTGTTLGGVKCTPSTLQFNSAYVAPCLPKFTGSNGGATSNGVTASTITLAQIEYPASANEQELEAEAAAAGDAPQPVISQVEQTFLNYFNKSFELYGRKAVSYTHLPGTMAMPIFTMRLGSRVVIGWPSKSTSPAVGTISPHSVLTRVDLPAPLVPRTATISPSSMSKSTPNSTRTLS